MGCAVASTAGSYSRELGLAEGFGFGHALGKVVEEQVHQPCRFGIVDLP
jgi:hypothetical protein